MAIPLSQNAVIHYNTGTYATPTWTPIANVRNVTLTDNADPVDVTTRSSGGIKEFKQGLKNVSCDFEILYDTSAAGFSSLETAYDGGTAVELLIHEDSATVSGAKGIRGEFTVLQFDIEQSFGDALVVNVSVSPTPNANAVPTRFTT